MADQFERFPAFARQLRLIEEIDCAIPTVSARASGGQDPKLLSRGLLAQVDIGYDVGCDVGLPEAPSPAAGRPGLGVGAGGFAGSTENPKAPPQAPGKAPPGVGGKDGIRPEPPQEERLAQIPRCPPK